MMPLENCKASYTYNDIGLVPTQRSFIESRDHVDLNTRHSGLWPLPIMAAPMMSLNTPRFIVESISNGVMPIRSRSKNPSLDIENFSKLDSVYRTLVGVSVGLRTVNGLSPMEIINKYVDLGIKTICVDVANGFHDDVGELCKEIKAKHKHLFVIAGNVGSVEGYRYLAECEVDAVRVGIGGGSACKTSIQTGVGIGQASLVREVFEYADTKEQRPLIIADGGIKSAGDMCKALALGADIVMIGGLFGRSKEALSLFSGEASIERKQKKKYIEGVSYKIRNREPLKDIIETLNQGLRSSVSYMGYRNLKDFIGLPDYNFRILSASSQTERGAHGLLWNK